MTPSRDAETPRFRTGRRRARRAGLAMGAVGVLLAGGFAYMFFEFPDAVARLVSGLVFFALPALFFAFVWLPRLMGTLEIHHGRLEMHGEQGSVVVPWTSVRGLSTGRSNVGGAAARAEVLEVLESASGGDWVVILAVVGSAGPIVIDGEDLFEPVEAARALARAIGDRVEIKS